MMVAVAVGMVGGRTEESCFYIEWLYCFIHKGKSKSFLPISLDQEAEETRDFYDSRVTESQGRFIIS